MSLKSIIIISVWSLFLSSCSSIYSYEIGNLGINSEIEQQKILDIAVTKVKDVFSKYNLVERECPSKSVEKNPHMKHVCKMIIDVKKPLMITIEVLPKGSSSIVTYESNGLNPTLDSKAKLEIYSILSKNYGLVKVI